MTDKKQPEALELTSVAESADLVGYPTAKKANAYYLCLLEDCADVIRKLHAENESLRAKLKTYEDLGDAGSDVQLLRTGYAAARLEIESLRKERADELTEAYMCGASWEKELAAQQPGAAGLIGALEDAQRAINSMKVEAETAAQGDEQMMLEACETISNEGLQADMAIRAALAPHGQALAHVLHLVQDAFAEVAMAYPKAFALHKVGLADTAVRKALATTTAQAAPAYKDSTPELHIGDSTFESWYSTYSPAHKADKQRARDAYAAGMGDPLVTAAPAAVTGPVVNRATVIEWLDANDIEVTDRQMDGLFHFAAPTTQPSPAVQGDALDAARYRYLRDGDWRENDKLESIIRLQLNSLWDAAIDDARAAQEGEK